MWEPVASSSRVSVPFPPPAESYHPAATFWFTSDFWRRAGHVTCRLAMQDILRNRQPLSNFFLCVRAATCPFRLIWKGINIKWLFFTGATLHMEENICPGMQSAPRTRSQEARVVWLDTPLWQNMRQLNTYVIIPRKASSVIPSCGRVGRV